MINSIYIRNIKKFDDAGAELNFELKTNKYNLCSAPNGFGKTSLAKAIKLLEGGPTKLVLNKEIAYQNNEGLSPEIRIKIDNVSYTADSSRNDIRSVLRCHVISSRIDVKTTQQNRGKYTYVDGLLDIADIEIMSKIPDKVSYVYKVTENKIEFGVNGKILTNFSPLFSRCDLWLLLTDFEVQKILTSMKNTTSDLYRVKQITDSINTLTGTTNSLYQQIDSDTNLFSEFDANLRIKQLKTKFSKIFDPGSTVNSREWFDFIWQLLKFWKTNSSLLTSLIRRFEYEKYKSEFETQINELNPTWKEIKVLEEKGKLIVRFPNATQISNGQRDFLTFVTDLTRVRIDIKYHPQKAHLVVIDEIIDYLDDANMLAIQAYLSSYIPSIPGGVYLCLLTHLSPHNFRSWLFSKKKLNEIYLDSSRPISSGSFLKFIAFRERLDSERKDNPDKEKLYSDLSSYYFHYNPDSSKNVTAELEEFAGDTIKTSWGKISHLKKEIITEVNIYLLGTEDYDPYGVCMGLRLVIEKKVYNSLSTEEQKKEFLKKFTTAKKLNFAEECGVDIPASYNLVSALHNEADHVKWDAEKLKFNEKNIVYSLKHPTIKHLISNIFDYKEGIEIQTECIL